jgi:hypothetical protein
VSKRWWALCSVYGVVLVTFGVLIARQSETTAKELVVEEVLIVGVPAIVFALCAALLWGESSNRFALVGGAIVAALVGCLVVMATWGFALPIAAGLIAVAIGNLDRAADVSGLRASRRFLGFAVALTVSGAAMGLLLPLAILVAVIGLALTGWKLTRPRV